MGFFLGLPVVRTLHERQLFFPMVVLIVVAVVLVQGSLERSQAGIVSLEEGDSDNTLQVPAPRPAPRPVLRTDLEKTPLTYVSDYWNQLAEGARQSLIAVGSSATPAVLVGPRLAITTVQPALDILQERKRFALTNEEPENLGDKNPSESLDTAPKDDNSQEGVDVANRAINNDIPSHRLLAWDQKIGLALFDVTTETQVPFTLSDPHGMPSGSYLGAVTLNESGDPTITPGHLVTTVEETNRIGTGEHMVLSMDFPLTLSVAAVVNLDGDMVGLAYVSPNGLRVVTASEVLVLIDNLQSGTICRSIEVSALSDKVRERLGLDSGVLVEYVQSEAFAPEPSLRDGDVLLEWGNTPLESTEQFMRLYDEQAPGSLVRYRVLRGRRRVTGGTVIPDRDCSPVTSGPVRLPRFGLAVQWIAEFPYESPEDTVVSAGWAVVTVAPGGPSAAAGIKEFDQLLSLDGRALEDQQDRPVLVRAGESNEALLMALRRGARAKLVVVPPRESAVVSVETEAETRR